MPSNVQNFPKLLIAFSTVELKKADVSNPLFGLKRDGFIVTLFFNYIFPSRT